MDRTTGVATSARGSISMTRPASPKRMPRLELDARNRQGTRQEESACFRGTRRTGKGMGCRRMMMYRFEGATNLGNRVTFPLDMGTGVE